MKPEITNIIRSLLRRRAPGQPSGGSIPSYPELQPSLPDFQGFQGPLCSSCSYYDFQIAFSRYLYEDNGLNLWMWDLEATRYSSSCPMCRLLVFAASDSDHFSTARGGKIYGDIDKDGGFLFSADEKPVGRRMHVLAASAEEHSGKYREETLDKARAQYNHCILPMPQQFPKRPKDTLYTGRKIESIIDPAMIKQWIRLCEQHHKTECCPSQMTATKTAAFRFRVIDIEAGSIINAPKKCRYFALSYVWGESPQMTLTKESVERLTTPGGIWNILDLLPKTIRDAIILCQRVQQQFLWIDALCIIQDDQIDKTAQINRMGTIYRGAALTIVAAAGSDCNAGLPGIFPRPLSQRWALVQGIFFITAEHSANRAMIKSKWNTRAWTMQEMVLSTRVLVFTNSQVFFWCSQNRFKEDIELETDESISLYNENIVQDLPLWTETKWDGPEVKKIFKWNGIEDGNAMKAYNMYQQLVRALVVREIKEHDDMLNAFAGICEYLAPHIGQFRHGLPLKYLASSIAWYNNRQSKWEIAQQTASSKLPSWSWAAWLHTDHSKVSFSNTDMPRPGIFGFSDDGEVQLLAPGWTHQHASALGVTMLREHLEDTVPLFDSVPNIKYLGSPLSNLLTFYTSFARLAVQRVPNRSAVTSQGLIDTGPNHLYHVVYNQFKLSHVPRPRLLLNEEWVKKQPELLSFIVLGGEVGDEHVQYELRIMLIEERDGISYRVGVPEEMLPMKAWIEAEPERKLIVLG